LKELQKIPGSGGERPLLKPGIVKAVTERYPHREEIDAVFEEDTPPNTLVDAIVQIVDGADLAEERGVLCAYALEAICWHIGTTFHRPIGFPSLEDLDHFFQPRGCPVSLRGQACCQCPVPIPQPGIPGIGCWQPAQVVEAERFFKNLALDGADPQVARGIAEIQNWLKAAVEHEANQATSLQESLKQVVGAAKLDSLMKRLQAKAREPGALVGFWY
jgi:hypothetical protein